ncbi:MAG: PilW family protein [bacterium]|nr:PilW family protein [bacterium]
MKKGVLQSLLYEIRPFLYIKRGHGFTMIELIVAMAVASVVAMSGFALFNQSNWSYQVQENIGEAQQNARVAMDRMVRDIRMAGFGLPEPPYTVLGLKSPITVSDATGYNGSDKITILGIGYEAGVLSTASGENEKEDPYLCYSPTTSGGDKILAANKVLSSRRYVSVDGVFFAELDTVASSDVCVGGVQLPLGTPGKLKGNFDAGTVYVIQAVEYSIATDLKGCSAASPCLVSKDSTGLRGSGNQLLAENIEDIQFAYGLDATGDGVLDYTTYTTASFVDSTLKESQIRAVRLSVSARTRKKDSKKHTFKRPAIENHPESGEDNYRRRILTRIVKVRN